MARTVRAAIVLSAALTLGGGPAAGQQKVPPGAAPDGAKKGTRFSHIVTLPTNDTFESKLEVAPQYLKGGEWAKGVHVLQSVLDHAEDAFVAVKRTGPDGSERVGWVSARSEARRLLATLPPRGLEAYEVANGPKAAALLGEAKKRGDLLQIALIAQRYPCTPAGRQAADLLGTYHLDRGQHATAARYFAGLLQGPDVARVAPLSLFKAALAFHRAGDRDRADAAWKTFAARAPKGLQLGDRLVGLAELKQELARSGVAGEAAAVRDWTVFRGGPKRAALARGTVGKLQARWEQATVEPSWVRAREWIEGALQQYKTRGQAPLPAAAPLTACSALLYRSHRGIHAVDRGGQLLWESAFGGSLEQLGADGATAAHAGAWVTNFLANGPHVLLENSVVGTLSTDRQRVYAVEDLALPPSPTNYGEYANRGGMKLELTFAEQLTDAVYHSRLLALELDGGRILWAAGLRGGKKEDPLSDTHFLGPPLPLGGKLYVLAEKEQTVRLVCLDAASGQLSWVQPLATPKNNVLIDGIRRTWAAHPAHAEGVLVCPTNAGAVVAVDLASRSLLWAHAYRDEVPPELPPMGRFRPRFRRGVLPAQPMNLSVKWKHTAPIIHGGKVLIAAPDGGGVDCLDLWTGALCWRVERQEEDLYLAGVVNERVLVVGKQQCYAVSLANGASLWNAPTGTTCGLGVAVGKVYYLPVAASKELKGRPAIETIDTDKGVVVHAAPLPGDRPPGNLLLWDGDVVSQTADRVAVLSPAK